MNRRDPGRLHVITDESIQSRFSHVELARFAADGGADVVQYREKRALPPEILARVGREMREALARSSTRLIVNDRVALAVAVEADGVHLGPEDPTPEEAAAIVGPDALIGATANDVARAVRVDRDPVTYLGVGPVYGTSSKERPAPTLGLDGLRAIVNATDRPVIAIGSIAPERVAEVLACGAHGVAVLSSVVMAEHPLEQVSAFRAAIDRALARCAG